MEPRKRFFRKTCSRLGDAGMRRIYESAAIAGPSEIRHIRDGVRHRLSTRAVGLRAPDLSHAIVAPKIRDPHSVRRPLRPDRSRIPARQGGSPPPCHRQPIEHKRAALVDHRHAPCRIHTEHEHAEAIGIGGGDRAAQLEGDQIAIGRHRDRAFRLFGRRLPDITQRNEIACGNVAFRMFQECRWHQVAAIRRHRASGSAPDQRDKCRHRAEQAACHSVFESVRLRKRPTTE